MKTSANKAEPGIVFIIPYFGKKPDYFELWLKSAEKNPNYTFFFYTDIELPISENSNVKVKKCTFEDIKERIKHKLGLNIKLKSPYKLCDYRPAFGYVFEEDIRGFDFWGFCDVDLIFGDLNHFITPEMLINFDKLFYHGHFCLFRNTEKMRQLFKERYPDTTDYKYAFSTNYSCHFDESATVAVAHKYDKTIAFYFDWVFFDADTSSYKLKLGNSECCAVWDNGKLELFAEGKAEPKEIMYIHLQKRQMLHSETVTGNRFAIFRTEFIDCSEKNIDLFFSSPLNDSLQSEFCRRQKKRRLREIINNIRSGALKFRLHKIFSS